MLTDCVDGFGQMLHIALKEYYFVSHNEDSVEDSLRGNDQLTYEINYPGLASTTIWDLSVSSQVCVDFLWRLFGVCGHTEGSPYFFYNNYKKDKLHPFKAAKDMQWKMLLPWCLVCPLMKTFSLIVNFEQIDM